MFTRFFLNFLNWTSTRITRKITWFRTMIAFLNQWKLWFCRCTVCLGDYHKEDILRALPPCGHFFHASCIDIWLHQHSTCPVCRVSLRDLPEKKRFMQPVFSSAIRFQPGVQSPGVSSNNQSSLNGQSMDEPDRERVVVEPVTADK